MDGEEVKPKPKRCPCGRIAMPVCGSDGKTYGNICTLNCQKRNDENLTLAHEGTC